jgi:hypothetical protein
VLSIRVDISDEANVPEKRADKHVPASLENPAVDDSILKKS